MKFRPPLFLAATALGACLTLAAAPAAMAQDAVPAIASGNTLLTVSAEGASTRTPDMASYSAGVTTQGTTASEAMGANSQAMARVIAALKKAGVADKDIQTTTLGLNPVYAPLKREADGSYTEAQRQIVGYQATNTVNVRQRKLADTGKVIDALVTAGANQVNGPEFTLAEPAAAQDEARVDAIKTARARADLYARAAGLRVVRVVSISESGGYVPRPVAMYAKSERAMMDSPAPPVAAGELQMTVNVTVQFELAP